MSTRFSVIVIGAGESGIAVGCLLKSKLSTTDFRIFDRQGGIGGAWYANRYPGVACDIPAIFYSYSFAPNYDWTTLFPPGQEIQQYLQSVCDKFDIRGNIQLKSEVSYARWIEDDKEWEVTVTNLTSKLAATEIFRCKVLVTCAGELVEPKTWPREVPGIDSFQGKVFHSARWDDEVSWADKDVVVIGTGCTAAQLVPALTKPPFAAKSVTQLMRAPPWVMARPETPPPKLMKIVSVLLRVVPGWFGKKRRQWFERRLKIHLERTVPPRYHNMLTPQFGVGCRRIIVDSGWLECLSLPNVELTTRPLTSIEPCGIGLGSEPHELKHGVEKAGKDVVKKPADMIILANGFETSTYLHRIKVEGKNGLLLHDVWNSNGGPGAYLSTAVHGFPNFFMVLGPNSVSGHSSAILASENVAGYVLNFIRLVLSGHANTVEVQKEAEQSFTAEVQRRSLDKVWQGCRNGYIQEGGWNSSICPFNQVHFSMMCKYPNWQHWNIEYTESGVKEKNKNMARRQTSRWATIIPVVAVTVLFLIYYSVFK